MSFRFMRSPHPAQRHRRARHNRRRSTGPARTLRGYHISLGGHVTESPALKRSQALADARFSSPSPIAASTAARWPLKETEIRVPQLWNRDREIAQHTLKALHILLVILPVPEIANIARAKLRSPSLIRRHDGIVEADRK